MNFGFLSYLLYTDHRNTAPPPNNATITIFFEDANVPIFHQLFRKDTECWAPFPLLPLVVKLSNEQDNLQMSCGSQQNIIILHCATSFLPGVTLYQLTR